MIKITALIITLNEEKHIGACIDSLTGVADEVIVVDSFSKDQTKKISTDKGAKVVDAEFNGFGPQRNMGAEKASNNYILVLDGDEVLSEDLKQSIVLFKNANMPLAAYAFCRLNFIGDRAIKTAGWYPDMHIRLYDRTRAKWNERQVHEDVEVNGETGWLTGDLLHYSYDNIEQVKEKSTRYARLGAEVYKEQNRLLLNLKMIFSPIFKFIKTYFMQLGFTDGKFGFLICYYRARETYLKYYWALK